MTAVEPILSVRDLRVSYHTVQGRLRVVDGVSLAVSPGEILGIAGESGCGKSTVVEGVLRLVRPPGRIDGGEVLFRGRGADPAPREQGRSVAAAAAGGAGAGAERRLDLLRLKGEALRRLRWNHIAYVPQGSMNSLNPVLRVREQLVDAMVDHGGVRSRAHALERLPGLLGSVGLSTAVLGMYPHELSGGMRQRVVIAGSIVLHPELVVADEPTTALDVSAQRLILQTLLQIRRKSSVAMVFVSHDLAVHAQLVDRVAIMYAGLMVEVATVYQVFEEPGHPYTWGLVQSLPRIDAGRRKLYGIPGLAPSPLDWPSGCRFRPRCPYAFDRCAAEVPAMRTLPDGRSVACHLYQDEEAPRLGRALEAMRAGDAQGARLRAAAETGAGAGG